MESLPHPPLINEFHYGLNLVLGTNHGGIRTRLSVKAILSSELGFEELLFPSREVEDSFDSFLEAIREKLLALNGAKRPIFIDAFLSLEYELNPSEVRRTLQMVDQILRHQSQAGLLVVYNPAYLTDWSREDRIDQVFVCDNKTLKPIYELRSPEWLSHFALHDLYIHSEFEENPHR